MCETLTLSVVTPTRGNFSEYWLQQLYNMKGNVEFILVYPPDVDHQPISDNRVRVIHSPFKGEVFQRLIGLLNASGKYVMALDDDDFAHPDILQLIDQYFEHFPDSWCLRLHMKKIDFRNTEEIYQPWSLLPDIEQLCKTVNNGTNNEGADKGATKKARFQEIPIAPLGNHFQLRFLVGPYLKRKDMHGAHIENFNNKVWKTELVKQTLIDLTQTMNIAHALTWIPRWSLDRMLGLYLQAKHFEKGKIVGHWMPAPEQIRYISMPQEVRKEFRLMLPSDALLAKRFPQYGYFWNLFFEQFWIAIKKTLRQYSTNLKLGK